MGHQGLYPNSDQGYRLFWKVGEDKNSAESLKILAESAAYDFSAQNWTKNAKFIDFLQDFVHGKCFLFEFVPEK
jgi:hypothetical protein